MDRRLFIDSVEVGNAMASLACCRSMSQGAAIPSQARETELARATQLGPRIATSAQTFAAALLIGLAGTVVAQQPQDDDRQPSAKPVLEEVIVTATKRDESVRDVPISIIALTGEKLEQSGAAGMEDYLRMTPGTSANANDPGRNYVAIRGINTDTGAAQASLATGFFLEDIPLNDPAFATSTPDLYPYDLKTIEVLKGPQGTLFGGSALAGALRYVPNHPDAETWAGSAFWSRQTIERGDSAITRGAMLNIPLLKRQQLALRGVYVDREAAGYIDDTGRGLEDVDTIDQQSSRVLLSWAPLEKLTVDLTWLDQETYQGDGPFADQFERLERDNTPGPTIRDTGFNVKSVKADYDLGFASLVAVLGDIDKFAIQDQNFDRFFGTEGDGSEDDAKVSAFSKQTGDGETRELRLVSSAEQFPNWNWLLGYFEQDFTQRIHTVIPLPNAPIPGIDPDVIRALIDSGALPETANTIADVTITSLARESAFFAETTYTLWQRLHLTVGARAFDTSLDSTSVGKGLLAVSALAEGETETRVSNEQEEDGINPKYAISFHWTDTLMLYASAAKGFRFGGVNPAPVLPGDGEVTETFESDSLWNYEVGVRSEWFDRSLRADLTLFHIDWKDIQLVQLRSNGAFTEVTNASEAESEGAELAIHYRLPVPGLQLQVSGAWIDAVLTEPFDQGSQTVPAGTRLPGTSEFQSSAILSYARPLFGVDFSSALSYAFVGERFNNIFHTDRMEQYETWGLQLGLGVEQWPGRPRLSLNVHNIKDKRGIGNVASADGSPNRDIYFIRPRTVELKLSAQF